MTPAPQFYLASSSPRRRTLLAGVGLHFDVIAVEIDETAGSGEDAAAFVVRMASGKAAAAVVAGYRPRLPVLAADTCVAIGSRILGKPRDGTHARAMLRLLSGKTHDVFTAVALQENERTWLEVSHSRVTFDTLMAVEIDRYCDSGEPADKAGAYAIQGLGCAFVKRIEGSYTGVVGLPMYETRRLLTRIGIDWL